MFDYIVRRLLLIIPTLLGVMLLNFAVIQFVPGGPIEQLYAQAEEEGADALARLGGGTQDVLPQSSNIGGYRGAEGLDDQQRQRLIQQFGFDLPPVERFVRMIGQYLTFDFGESIRKGQTVAYWILDAMPVAIALGLPTVLITYLVSIPLGVAKARREGSTFDIWSSGIVIFGYAIPSYLFAVLLVILFAGGSFLKLFPLSGIRSPDPVFHQLSWAGQLIDYAWHLTLPVLAMIISNFATLTILTKNSLLDELSKNYVTTARSKGLTENRILYGHVFRNGMLIVIAGFPGAFVGVFFTASLLIEYIFSLNGLGTLGFEAVVGRDYPIVFATLFLFTLIGLVLKLISDLTYVLVDPRIDFEAQ